MPKYSRSNSYTTRRLCGKCRGPLPHYHAHTDQLCPRCVVETANPDTKAGKARIETARQTIVWMEQRARAAVAVPVRVVDPAAELRRQEQARQPREAAVQAVPMRRVTGNVRDW